VGIYFIDKNHAKTSPFGQRLLFFPTLHITKNLFLTKYNTLYNTVAVQHSFLKMQVLVLELIQLVNTCLPNL